MDLHRPWEPWPFDEPSPELFRSQLHKTAYCLFRLGDDALVGQVNVNLIVRGPFQNACLGYWIGAPFAGMGYMTEGVSLVLAECFTTLGLHRIEANIIPENEASLRVARKCGLRLEGFSPRFLQIGGSWRDHERWAITAEEWPASGL
jgi:ribosomal-protein-alanine N-acetyltransferase